MRTLIIGDCHLPFQHKDWLTFTKQVYDDFKCDSVIQIGDLMDQYSWTRFDKNADAMGAREEYNKAMEELAKFFKVFPKGKLVLGNHDLRLMKRASEANIPTWVMRDFQEMYGIPKEWEVDYSFVVDNVLYVHGEGLSSTTAALSRHHRSVVFGHTHQANIAYTATDLERIFAFNVGCIIDIDKYAFEYAKGTSGKRPLLGVGVVIDGTQPVFVPMDLGSKIEYVETPKEVQYKSGVHHVPAFSIDSKLTNPIKTKYFEPLGGEELPKHTVYEILTAWYPQLVKTMPATYVRWTKVVKSVDELPETYRNKVKEAINKGNW